MTLLVSAYGLEVPQQVRKSSLIEVNFGAIGSPSKLMLVSQYSLVRALSCFDVIAIVVNSESLHSWAIKFPSFQRFAVSHVDGAVIS